MPMRRKVIDGRRRVYAWLYKQKIEQPECYILSKISWGVDYGH